MSVGVNSRTYSLGGALPLTAVEEWSSPRLPQSSSSLAIPSFVLVSSWPRAPSCLLVFNFSFFPKLYRTIHFKPGLRCSVPFLLRLSVLPWASSPALPPFAGFVLSPCPIKLTGKTGLIEQPQSYTGLCSKQFHSLLLLASLSSCLL
jgi:hypothetical protein